jgi:hypothetical protein
MTARPNAELAYRVLDYVTAHPEQHDQATWFRQTGCGTVACFAGWTVALAGHRIDVDPDPNPETGYLYYDAIDGDRGTTIREVAERDLGIAGLTRPCTLHAGCCYSGESYADTLFDTGNTREDLGRLVAEIFGPRPAWTAADEQTWRECAHRADYLTPAHHARECAYHRGEVDEWGQPVDDVPPNAGSGS